ncbi:hydrolase [Gordonia sp. CPCC 205515]|uniref:hydrolase n=1 Tax=Gordonia sp. CPCC 205515 TaxID=3140791 RepID=UPI003AF38FB4
MNPGWICDLCGNEFPPAGQPPTRCPICADDRQFIPRSGPSWSELNPAADNELTAAELEPGFWQLTIRPSVGIGQHTYVIESTDGNVLWEPPGFIGPSLTDWLDEHGGLCAITASHPHLVGASVSLSHRYGRVPVWFNDNDRRWVTRPDPVIEFWRDTTNIAPGLHLVQCGGHFPGSAVLHLPQAADGRGALLTGDTIMAVPHPEMVSFMRSFPNLIPLSPRLVRGIADRVAELRFDRIYAAFGAPVAPKAAEIVASSAQRYIDWVTDAQMDPDERNGQASG